MTTPRDERGPMSRLPEDDGYWERLTDRLVLDAAERLGAYRHRRRRWWHGLSRVSTPLTLAGAAAVVATLVWLPEPIGPSQSASFVSDVFGLSPIDPLADRLVRAPTPPTVATLIVTPNPEISR